MATSSSASRCPTPAWRAWRARRARTPTIRPRSRCASAAARRAALFSLIATVGTPLDVALQDLRLEFFFPADAATERWFRANAGARGPTGHAD